MPWREFDAAFNGVSSGTSRVSFGGPIPPWLPAGTARDPATGDYLLGAFEEGFRWALDLAVDEYFWGVFTLEDLEVWDPVVEPL